MAEVSDVGDADTQGWRWRLALIAAGALVVRVAILVATRHYGVGFGDAYFYHHQANLLAEGHGFIVPAEFFTNHRSIAAADHPPLWVIYLASFSLVGLKSWMAHRVAGALVGVATVVVIGLLGREVGGRRVGLVAAGIASVYPYLWLSELFGMSEGLVTLTAAMAALLAFRFARRPSLQTAAALGLACGLAAMTRSEQLLLFPFVVIPVMLRARTDAARTASRSLRIRWMAGALILFVIPMTPWIARNLTAFRYPVTFSTNFEGALAAANCSTTYDTKSPFFAYWDIRCGIIDVPAGDASITARAWRSKAIDFATSHEDRLPVVAAGRLGRSWLVYRPLQQPGLDHIEGRPLQPSRVGLWSYALVAPLAVAGAVILRRRRVWMLPLLAIPLITTLTEVLVYATTRFRAPAEAVLVVFAAVAIDASLRARNVFGHLSRARHRR